MWIFVTTNYLMLAQVVVHCQRRPLMIFNHSPYGNVSLYSQYFVFVNAEMRVEHYLKNSFDESLSLPVSSILSEFQLKF